MGLGRDAWKETRATLQRLLAANEVSLTSLIVVNCTFDEIMEEKLIVHIIVITVK